MSETMKRIAIVLFHLFSLFYLVELRYLSKEECITAQNISLIQDDGTIRTEYVTLKPSAAKFNFWGLFKPKAADVAIYLHTRKNLQDGKRFKTDEAERLNIFKIFDPKLPNFFIIHGWTASKKSRISVSVKNAILRQTSINVFVVDWSPVARFPYPAARRSISEVGALVARFIKDMAKNFSLPMSAFKIAGHSLGAHIAGYIGKNVDGQIDYIVALDPARPLISLKDSDRLSTSDASFVQVIHTNGLFLGFSSSLGHVDIFPNDGYVQPGCNMDITQSCSHGRSYQFFAESILFGGFTTKKCASFKQYKAGECKNQPSSFLGRLNIDKNASGDYYLETNAASPFSKY